METRTTKIVTNEVKKLGYEMTTGIGKTGIVGRIEGDLTSLWGVPDGAIVSIRRASENG